MRPKRLFKIEILLSRVDLQPKTRLHLFYSLILTILLYGCEFWGYENKEQIEVFHRNFFETDAENTSKRAQGHGVRRIGPS